MQGPAFVKIDGVDLVYRQAEEETLAVQDLTLDIQEGEFVAVVGPSGCGKSTLMKLVTGLLEPSNGLITVGGKPVRGAIQGVGMAFQNRSEEHTSDLQSLMRISYAVFCLINTKSKQRQTLL